MVEAHRCTFYWLGKKSRFNLLRRIAAMRMHSIALSVLVAMLEMVSARAKPCQYQDILDRAAKLPSFIVIPAGSTPDEVLRADASL